MSLFSSIAGGLGTVFGPLGTVIGGLVGGVGDYFTDSQKIKAAETESTIKLKQARTDALIDVIKTQGAGDIAWENTQISNSGWKDEFWTILISTPLILVWIPGMQDTVMQGFATFDKMPEWYQVALGVAYSAAFGYKKFADFMSLKNGVKLDTLQGLKPLMTK